MDPHLPVTMEPFEESTSGLGIVSHDSLASLDGDNNEENDKSIAKGGVTTPFPWKLHIMLDAMDRTGDKSVVCWQPHGRAFMVHKPREFVQQVMPHFFNQTKYASFQRQLNLYGFSRLTHGADKGAYYHGCFVRGERSLCRGMIRQKIKGTKVRRSLAPDEEPNFYSPHYNNNKSIPFPIMPSPQTTSSNTPTQRAQVTPEQSPRKVTVKPHGLSTSEATASMVPTLSAPMTPTLSAKDSTTGTTTQQSPTTSPTIPRTVSPHQALSTLYRVNAVPSSQPPSVVRGGDLLFFEGQPFRYLEHLEELPPPPTFQAKGLPMMPPPGLQRNPNGAIHNVITNIVSRDPPFLQQQQDLSHVVTL